jgi:hypothetical protein
MTQKTGFDSRQGPRVIILVLDCHFAGIMVKKFHVRLFS